MYDATPACFLRSGVMKMPLITASHFFAFSAGRSPGNAVLTAAAVLENVFASAVAMSTSKPTILPLVVPYSIGGNVGSVQYLNVAVWRPSAPAAKTVAAISVTASEMTSLRIDFSPPRDPDEEEPIRKPRPRPPSGGAGSPAGRSSARW